MTRRTPTERLVLFARENARDAVRERQAHVLVVFFALLGGIVAYNAGRLDPARQATATPGLSGQLFGLFSILIPLVSLGLVAPSLVEKRTSGALTVLLGLPFSRGTVVVGTLLGQCLVLGAATLSALLVALGVGLVMGAPMDPLGMIGIAIALLVLAVTFAAFAVAISASVRTSTRATVAALVVFVVFVLHAWGHLPGYLLYLSNGFAYPATTPTWVEFVRSLNPMTAFNNAGLGIFPDLFSVTAGSRPANPAFFEAPAFASVVLLAWIVGAVWVGYHRFRSSDLLY